MHNIRDHEKFAGAIIGDNLPSKSFRFRLFPFMPTTSRKPPFHRFFSLRLDFLPFPGLSCPPAYRMISGAKREGGKHMTVRKLTSDFVKHAVVQGDAERAFYWDEKLPGFGLMVTESGHRSWVVQYRAHHRTRRITINSVLSLEDARKQARDLLGQVARGGDPAAERRKAVDAEHNALRAVIAEYFEREGNRLRSAAKRRAMLERLVVPRLGAWSVYDIRRSNIQRLLDEIEDQSGKATAHLVLAFLRKIFTWYASRADDFQSPFVRGMARLKAADSQRDRVLSDDEIRALWLAAEKFQAPWGQYIRLLFLTACRRREISDLRWSEVNGDLVIPGSRVKGGHDLVVPLSAAARAILAEAPQIEGCDYVFTNDGFGPINSFSKGKAAFDRACGVKDWRLHDLRRTARTLLSRAAVNTDIAERCLGHIIKGVRATYDHHEFRDEKLLAFEKLATIVEQIVRPQENVVVLRGAS
jgi:integrase